VFIGYVSGTAQNGLYTSQLITGLRQILFLNKKIEDQSTSFAQDHTAGKWQAKSQAEGGHLGESLCVVSSLALLGTTLNQENRSLKVIIS